MRGQAFYLKTFPSAAALPSTLSSQAQLELTSSLSSGLL